MRRLVSDPFAGLERLQRALDRALERPSPVWTGRVSGRVFPPINVFEEKDGYRIRAEVPGLSPDALAIESHGDTMTISGHREAPPEGKGDPHRRERWSGDFSRSFHLPRDLELGKAAASYVNGILTLRIPRREEAKPRQITVETS